MNSGGRILVCSALGSRVGRRFPLANKFLP
jgi:hypothetical protein